MNFFNWNNRKNKRKEIISFLFLLLTLSLLLTCCEFINIEPYTSEDKDSVVLNVPKFESDYGCTVISMAMLMQYYETLGYELIDSPDDIINRQHMDYYAYPIDSRNMLLPDSSVRKNPPQNCLADFLKTSWYREECWYKATLLYNIIPGMRDYLEYKGGKYELVASSFSGYGEYMEIIDDGFPACLTTKKGSNTHSCLGIGYIKSDSAFITSDGDVYKWNTSDKDKLRIFATLDLRIQVK